MEAKGRGCRTVVGRGPWGFFVVGGVKGDLKGCFVEFMFRVGGVLAKVSGSWYVVM